MDFCQQNTLPTWENLCLHNTSRLINEHEKSQINLLKNKKPSMLSFSFVKLVIHLSNEGHTWRKFLDCPWEDIVDIVHDQAVRNMELKSKNNLNSSLADGISSHLNRKHNQLPCTAFTTKKRVDQAKKLCSFNDPILVIGDDDHVGIELMNAGFKNITSIDIDQRVCQSLQKKAKKLGHDLQILNHDISKPPPKDHIKNYKLVFLDPMYSLEGIEMFLKGGIKFSNAKEGTLFFLSLHLMSLLRPGIETLPLIFDDYGLKIQKHMAGFNSYPIPKYLWYVIKLFNVGFMKTKVLSTTNFMFPYFHSDAILLEKISQRL